ncbi:MAG: sorbosone dehydrogenase family protein [Caulobacteraceae bacterium]|nr:sorbosone dehydrogenase family protein [Caulobacter sp.]
MRLLPFSLAAASALALAACGQPAKLSVADGTGANPALPPPAKSLLPVVNIAKATGWPKGAGPTAAPGLRTAAFATGLDHPRWLYQLPNGDVLVAETNAPPKPDDSKGVRGMVMKFEMKGAGAGAKSANRITLLRDTNGDGVADLKTVFIGNLNSPFGMTLVGNTLYVADTDAILAFPYTPGETQIVQPGRKVIDLPAGRINHHWTKNVIASPDGSKLFVTVGSNSNVGDKGMAVERGRAAIWEVDPRTGLSREFATGIRNPNGMFVQPQTGKLWAAVNERDEIGGDLVPDYMTSVQDGGFYGWPYSYYGQHVDDRVKPQRPDLVARAIKPDYALGPHTASLGMAWHQGDDMGPAYAQGAFVGQHGSWNRKPRSGYKVIFVPFAGGAPSGPPVDVLTGFLDGDSARGRPVGVITDKTGGILVADDVGNTVWRVSASGAPAPKA